MTRVDIAGHHSFSPIVSGTYIGVIAPVLQAAYIKITKNPSDTDTYDIIYLPDTYQPARLRLLRLFGAYTSYINIYKLEEHPLPEFYRGIPYTIAFMFNSEITASFLDLALPTNSELLLYPYPNKVITNNLPERAIKL